MLQLDSNNPSIALYWKENQNTKEFDKDIVISFRKSVEKIGLKLSRTFPHIYTRLMYLYIS